MRKSYFFLKLKNLVTQLNKKLVGNSEVQLKQNYVEKNYFQQAQTWADDLNIEIIASRNRYKAAFYFSMTISILLILLLFMLTPLKTITPLLINHYENGIVTVKPLKKNSLAIDKPNPVPGMFLTVSALKKRSDIYGMSFSPIPIPSSET